MCDAVSRVADVARALVAAACARTAVWLHRIWIACENVKIELGATLYLSDQYSVSVYAHCACIVLSMCLTEFDTASLILTRLMLP